LEFAYVTDTSQVGLSTSPNWYLRVTKTTRWTILMAIFSFHNETRELHRSRDAVLPDFNDNGYLDQTFMTVIWFLVLVPAFR
jgi:hypothetical protein